MNEFPIFNVNKIYFLFGFRIEDNKGNFWEDS